MGWQGGGCDGLHSESGVPQGRRRDVWVLRVWGPGDSSEQGTEAGVPAHSSLVGESQGQARWQGGASDEGRRPEQPRHPGARQRKAGGSGEPAGGQCRETRGTWVMPAEPPQEVTTMPGEGAGREHEDSKALLLSWGGGGGDWNMCSYRPTLMYFHLVPKTIRGS